MRRGEVYWADVDSSAGRRPVVVLSRSGAIPVLSRVTVAFVTRTIRDIASEVHVLDVAPIGRLSLGKLGELDRALRFALGIRA